MTDSDDDLGTIARGTGVALWRQIAEQLEAEIGGGAHAPDSPFPTEAQLSHRFGVNRHTIRRSVAELARRGLLRVEQGRGAFIADHALDYALGPRTRFSENLLQQGRRPGQETLRLIDALPAPPKVARALDVAATESVVLIELIRRADAQPISVGSTYFPANRLPGIAAALREHGSISAALGAIGHGDYRRRSTRVIARLPTDDERRRLQLLEGRPVLVTEGVDVDRLGAPLSFSIACFAADRAQLVLET
jgi:GntR family phosphonate transport system transcriptional regulator